MVAVIVAASIVIILVSTIGLAVWMEYPETTNAKAMSDQKAKLDSMEYQLERTPHAASQKNYSRNLTNPRNLKK